MIESVLEGIISGIAVEIAKLIVKEVNNKKKNNINSEDSLTEDNKWVQIESRLVGNDHE